MVDMINGASVILKGSLGGLAQKQIELNEDEEQTQAILSLLSEKQETMPVIAEASIKAISEIDVEKIVDYDFVIYFFSSYIDVITAAIKKRYAHCDCSDIKVLMVNHIDCGKNFFLCMHYCTSLCEQDKLYILCMRSKMSSR